MPLIPIQFWMWHLGPVSAISFLCYLPPVLPSPQFSYLCQPVTCLKGKATHIILLPYSFKDLSGISFRIKSKLLSVDEIMPYSIGVFHPTLHLLPKYPPHPSFWIAHAFSPDLWIYVCLPPIQPSGLHLDICSAGKQSPLSCDGVIYSQNPIPVLLPLSTIAYWIAFLVFKIGHFEMIETLSLLINIAFSSSSIGLDIVGFWGDESS